MAIKEVLAGGFVPRDPVRKPDGAAETKKTVPPADRAQVSGEARSLYQTEQSRRMDEIKARLDSGFYDRQDVIEKIAGEVLKDLQCLPE